eukprot:2163019-Pleurochrysis_carterae.AAC.1
MSTCEQKKERVHSIANLACLHERARDVRRMLRAAAQLHDKLLCARVAAAPLKCENLGSTKLTSSIYSGRCRVIGP